MPIVEAGPLSEVMNPILYSARAGESEAVATIAAVTPAINPARIIAMIHPSDLLRRNEDASARERSARADIANPTTFRTGAQANPQRDLSVIGPPNETEPSKPALRAALHPVSPRRRSRRSWF